MTTEDIKNVLKNLNSCQEWSLMLLRFRKRNSEYVCNTHNIVVTTKNALIDFVSDLSKTYTDNHGKIDSYQTVQPYDGSAEGTLIYQIAVTDALVSESYNKILLAINNPDVGGNPLEFNANTYVLRGNVVIDGDNKEITLFTIINPFRTLKHAWSWTGEAFKSVPGKLLALRSHVDVLLYDGCLYFFNMNGEKLFDMERAYKQICDKKIDEVLDAQLVNDEDCFRQYASSGFNPRKFVSFNKNRVDKLKSDKAFHDLVVKKFGVTCDSNGAFDSTDKKNVNRLVKFICGKGMIDPTDEKPVEVDGSRAWG